MLKRTWCGPVPFSKVQWISHCCFVMVITKEEVRNTTKAEDHKPGLGHAQLLGASPCWWTPLSGASSSSTAACDAATSVSRRSQQPRLFCLQSSCYTQFIKMITQATAGKPGAWNLPRLIPNCPGILGKSRYLPSPWVLWPINQRITAAFSKVTYAPNNLYL